MLNKLSLIIKKEKKRNRNLNNSIRLKTGLFKWNKDYNGAVGYFDDAAKFYKGAKMWDMAIKVFEETAVCNEKINE